MSEATERVQQIIASARNFSAANTKTLDDLKELKSMLVSVENSAYDALGVRDIHDLNDAINNIEGIREKIHYLDAGGRIFNEIKQDYVLTDSASKNQEDVYKEENIFDLFTDLVNQSDLGQQVIDDLINNPRAGSIDIFTEYLKTVTAVFNGYVIPGDPISIEFTANAANSLTGYYSKKREIGRTAVKINLGKSITPLNIKITDHNFEISGTPELTSSVRDVIAKQVRPALNTYLNRDLSTNGLKISAKSVYQQNPQKWRDIVNKYIKKYFPKVDLSFAETIALNDSSGQLSGYLGELQSIIAFQYAFPNSKAYGTGTEAFKGLTSSGQEAPIDTVLKILNESFNIQVKNVDKASYSWEVSFNEAKAMGAISFITGRLQIPASTQLSNFFGAATYNNMNPAYSHIPGYQEYGKIYSGFQSVFQGQMTKMFDSFIPNIIRLSTYFSEGTANFEEGWNYNNFYMFKGKIIPSSVIVQSVMDAITMTPETFITSRYAMYPGASHYTKETPIAENYADYADTTKIAYNITFRFKMAFAKLGI